jgi:CheY-like chemotaxis protein|tara:strand:- start:151649 stop:152077 length:429 start_codon:yes stop_codon:yes gene_type:complete
VTKSVLLADDEPLVIRLFGLAVRAAGYAPRFASTGEEAFAAVLADPPALLVTDLNMPDISGDALAERVFAQGLKRFPIILLTADEAVAARALDERGIIDDVLLKNVGFQGFQERLAYWIETPFGDLAHPASADLGGVWQAPA